MSKNAVIFGDSYSTFEGYIPDGYAAYYYKDFGDTDVRCVSETWWHQVLSDAQINLVRNDSWSGSTVCYTGWGGIDCSETNSFIFRLKKLISENFFEKNDVNTVFFFGGTNDCWSDAPLGKLKCDAFEKEDLYCVLPGAYYFLKTLREALPNAAIYCLENNELKPELYEVYDLACKDFDITKVSFEHIDKTCGHPTIQGMKDIKREVLKALE